MTVENVGKNASAAPITIQDLREFRTESSRDLEGMPPDIEAILSGYLDKKLGKLETSLNDSLERMRELAVNMDEAQTPRIFCVVPEDLDDESLEVLEKYKKDTLQSNLALTAPANNSNLPEPWVTLAQIILSSDDSISNFFMKNFKLHLMCEYGHFHFLDNVEGYSLKEPAEFLRIVAPFVSKLFGGLFLAGAWLPSQAGSRLFLSLSRFFDSLAKGSFDLYQTLHPLIDDMDEKHRFQVLSDVALRQFATFLAVADPGKYYGGLQRVRVGANFFWVCKEHAFVMQGFSTEQRVLEENRKLKLEVLTLQEELAKLKATDISKEDGPIQQSTTTTVQVQDLDGSVGGGPKKSSQFCSIC
mmetsp:Transcript_21930/g.36331  ORF Transcript_21930/g.36331 Transcript_21930/m.36331 type:complete len:358 (-) Transcript_21930:288-1361(-)